MISIKKNSLIFPIITFLLLSCTQTIKRERVDKNRDALLKESSRREEVTSDAQSIKSMLFSCQKSSRFNVTESIDKLLRQKKLSNNDAPKILGHCFFYQRKYSKSLFYYRLWLSLAKSKQEKAIILNNIGLIFAISGNYIKADRYLKESIKHYKKFLVPHYNLSLVNVSLGITDSQTRKTIKRGLEKRDPMFVLLNNLSEFQSGSCRFSSLDAGEFNADVKALKLGCEYIKTNKIKDDLDFIKDAALPEIRKIRLRFKELKSRNGNPKV